MTAQGLRRVGHKGADLIAPGNTAASFDAALAAGVDMIEFDVLPERGGDEAPVRHQRIAAPGPNGRPGPGRQSGARGLKRDQRRQAHEPRAERVAPQPWDRPA